ncbi:MAG: tyrosine-type recombinase/integrase [Bdellovibrionales bacterium]|nr:tyrosine-type recombinase/integrase [Bdellovibrionales bacterium]
MLPQFNAKNEIVKKIFERYLELDERTSHKTNEMKLRSIRSFEAFTKFADFSSFSEKQAIGFREHCRGLVSRMEQPISFATIYRMLDHLKCFFQWLSQEPGWRKNINPNDVRGFNLNLKEENIARVRRLKDIPTLEQVQAVIAKMPIDTELQRRNQALIAFQSAAALRVSALISLRLGDFDEYQLRVVQDPRHVKTKASKQIVTQLFPVDANILEVVLGWIRYLKIEKGFSLNDPLFPSAKSEFDKGRVVFKYDRLSKTRILSATTARTVFKDAFESAGIKYFNPHGFRDMQVRQGERLCKTPEQFKAWSQNLGHKSPLTTFTSYGEVPVQKQCDLIKELVEAKVSKAN